MDSATNGVVELPTEFRTLFSLDNTETAFRMLNQLFEKFGMQKTCFFFVYSSFHVLFTPLPQFQTQFISENLLFIFERYDCVSPALAAFETLFSELHTLGPFDPDAITVIFPETYRDSQRVIQASILSGSKVPQLSQAGRGYLIQFLTLHEAMLEATVQALSLTAANYLGSFLSALMAADPAYCAKVLPRATEALGLLAGRISSAPSWSPPSRAPNAPNANSFSRPCTSPPRALPLPIISEGSNDIPFKNPRTLSSSEHGFESSHSDTVSSPRLQRFPALGLGSMYRLGRPQILEHISLPPHLAFLETYGARATSSMARLQKLLGNHTFLDEQAIATCICYMLTSYNRGKMEAEAARENAGSHARLMESRDNAKEALRVWWSWSIETLAAAARDLQKRPLRWGEIMSHMDRPGVVMRKDPLVDLINAFYNTSSADSVDFLEELLKPWNSAATQLFLIVSSISLTHSCARALAQMSSAECFPESAKQIFVISRVLHWGTPTRSTSSVDVVENIFQTISKRALSVSASRQHAPSLLVLNERKRDKLSNIFFVWKSKPLVARLLQIFAHAASEDNTTSREIEALFEFYSKVCGAQIVQTLVSLTPRDLGVNPTAIEKCNSLIREVIRPFILSARPRDSRVLKKVWKKKKYIVLFVMTNVYKENPDSVEVILKTLQFLGGLSDALLCAPMAFAIDLATCACGTPGFSLGDWLNDNILGSGINFVKAVCEFLIRKILLLKGPDARVFSHKYFQEALRKCVKAPEEIVFSSETLPFLGVSRYEFTSRALRSFFVVLLFSFNTVTVMTPQWSVLKNLLSLFYPDVYTQVEMQLNALDNDVRLKEKCSLFYRPFFQHVMSFKAAPKELQEIEIEKILVTATRQLSMLAQIEENRDLVQFIIIELLNAVNSDEPFSNDYDFLRFVGRFIGACIRNQFLDERLPGLIFTAFLKGFVVGDEFDKLILREAILESVKHIDSTKLFCERLPHGSPLGRWPAFLAQILKVKTVMDDELLSGKLEILFAIQKKQYKGEITFWSEPGFPFEAIETHIISCFRASLIHTKLTRALLEEQGKLSDISPTKGKPELIKPKSALTSRPGSPSTSEFFSDPITTEGQSEPIVSIQFTRPEVREPPTQTLKHINFSLNNATLENTHEVIKTILSKELFPEFSTWFCYCIIRRAQNDDEDHSSLAVYSTILLNLGLPELLGEFANTILLETKSAIRRLVLRDLAPQTQKDLKQIVNKFPSLAPLGRWQLPSTFLNEVKNNAFIPQFSQAENDIEQTMKTMGVWFGKFTVGIAKPFLISEFNITAILVQLFRAKAFRSLFYLSVFVYGALQACVHNKYIPLASGYCTSQLAALQAVINTNPVEPPLSELTFEHSIFLEDSGIASDDNFFQKSFHELTEHFLFLMTKKSFARINRASSSSARSSRAVTPAPVQKTLFTMAASPPDKTTRSGSKPSFCHSTSPVSPPLTPSPSQERARPYHTATPYGGTSIKNVEQQDDLNDLDDEKAEEISIDASQFAGIQVRNFPSVFSFYFCRDTVNKICLACSKLPNAANPNNSTVEGLEEILNDLRQCRITGVNGLYRTCLQVSPLIVEGLSVIADEILEILPAVKAFYEKLAGAFITILLPIVRSRVAGRALALAKVLCKMSMGALMPSFYEIRNIFISYAKKNAKALAEHESKPLLKRLFDNVVSANIKPPDMGRTLLFYIFLEAVSEKFAVATAKEIVEQTHTYVTKKAFDQAAYLFEELGAYNGASALLHFPILGVEKEEFLCQESKSPLRSFIKLSQKPPDALHSIMSKVCIFDALKITAADQRALGRYSLPNLNDETNRKNTLLMPPSNYRSRTLFIKLLKQHPKTHFSQRVENVQIAWAINSKLVDASIAESQPVFSPMFLTQCSVKPMNLKKLRQLFKQIYTWLRNSTSELFAGKNLPRHTDLWSLLNTDPINLALTQILLLAQASAISTNIPFLMGIVANSSAMLFGCGSSILQGALKLTRNNIFSRINIEKELDRLLSPALRKNRAPPLCSTSFWRSVHVSIIKAVAVGMEHSNAKNIQNFVQAFRLVICVAFFEMVKRVMFTEHSTSIGPFIRVKMVAKSLVLQDLLDLEQFYALLVERHILEDPRAAGANNIALLSGLANELIFGAGRAQFLHGDNPLLKFLVTRGAHLISQQARLARQPSGSGGSGADAQGDCGSVPLPPEDLAKFFHLISLSPNVNSTLLEAGAVGQLRCVSPYGPLIHSPLSLADALSEFDQFEYAFMAFWDKNTPEIIAAAKALTSDWKRTFKNIPADMRIRESVITQYVRLFSDLGVFGPSKCAHTVIRAIFDELFASTLGDDVALRHLDTENECVEIFLLSDGLDAYTALMVELLLVTEELLPSWHKAQQSMFASFIGPALQALAELKNSHMISAQIFLDKLFANLFAVVAVPSSFTPGERINLAHLLSSCLLLLAPCAYPSLFFAWFGVISSADVVECLLGMEGVTCEERKVLEQDFLELLICLFKFLSLVDGARGQIADFIHSAVFRFVLYLVHDFPDLLMENYLQLCLVLPPRALQLRNLVLSTYPVSRPPMSPFLPSLKVYRLREIQFPPPVGFDAKRFLSGVGVLRPLQRFLAEIGPETRQLQQALLVEWLISKLFPKAGPQPELVHLVPFYLIGHVAKYVRAFESRSVAELSAFRLLQALLEGCSPAQRYGVLFGLVDHLRFPNLHTYAVSLIVLTIFHRTRDLGLQEQIIRVISERVFIARPQPWGLLVAFLELLRNRKYALWAHPAIAGAPLLRERFEEFSRAAHAKK